MTSLIFLWVNCCLIFLSDLGIKKINESGTRNKKNTAVIWKDKLHWNVVTKNWLIGVNINIPEAAKDIKIPVTVLLVLSSSKYLDTPPIITGTEIIPAESPPITPKPNKKWVGLIAEDVT